MLKLSTFFALTVLGLSTAQASEKGFLGFRYSEQPEGLIITNVVDGSEAAAAGIAVGDRIISVDGVDVRDAEGHPSLRGELGSQVELGIVPALSTEPKTLMVKRGKRAAKANDTEKRSPKVISRFSGALYNGKIKDIKKAAQGLVESDFGGRDAKDAIGRNLVRAIKRKRKKQVRAALEILTQAPEPSAGLKYRIGQAYFTLGDEHEKSAQWLQSLVDSYPNDVAKSLGTRGLEEEWLANSKWLSGDRDGAIALTRSLVPRRQVNNLLKRVGMANPAPTVPWEIELNPLDDVDVELLDGSSWTLSSHRGKPVVLVFWATWCGPCKKEMPALASLVRKRADWPVEFLAVSTDKESVSDKVKKMVKGWDLPFPSTQTDGLNQRFGVSGLPSMRVIGPDGSLRSESRGYSKSSISKLVKTLDTLVSEASDPDQQKSKFPYGSAWGTTPPVVRSIFAHQQIRQIVGDGSNVVLQIADHGAMNAPVTDGSIGGSLEIEETQNISGEKGIAWFGGPVSYGTHWVRALREEADTWMVTTPSRIVAVVGSGEQLWIALKDGLLAIDKAGKVLHNLDVSVDDMAPAEDGGIWAVDGKERLRIGPDGSALLRDDAEGSTQIAEDGTWTTEGIRELLAGRFGPEGETRVVGLNERGTIVGLGSDGVAALRIHIDGKTLPSLAHADLDGDGRDELLISSWGRGVATVALEIP
jgi:thiol-disulfide isomerase/thioredoxin